MSCFLCLFELSLFEKGRRYSKLVRGKHLRNSYALELHHGLVVQGYECCLGMAEVGGSIPSQSTIHADISHLSLGTLVLENSINL